MTLGSSELVLIYVTQTDPRQTQSIQTWHARTWDHEENEFQQAFGHANAPKWLECLINLVPKIPVKTAHTTNAKQNTTSIIMEQNNKARLRTKDSQEHQFHDSFESVFTTLSHKPQVSKIRSLGPSGINEVEKQQMTSISLSFLKKKLIFTNS